MADRLYGGPELQFQARQVSTDDGGGREYGMYIARNA